jgi:hypothetical protein
VSKCKGWRTIKTLSVEETRSIRARELRGAAETHADIGEDLWALEYQRRAEDLERK